VLAVTESRRTALRALEGRRITLALRGGSRIDDAQLVSSGSGGARHLWLFQNGTDTFVPFEDVLELWDEHFRTVS
jgi:hypothetical protein